MSSNEQRPRTLRWRRTELGLEAAGAGCSFLIKKTDRGWEVQRYGLDGELAGSIGEALVQRAAKDMAEKAYADQMMSGFFAWDTRNGTDLDTDYGWAGKAWMVHRTHFPHKEHALDALLRATEMQVDPRPGCTFVRIPMTPGRRSGYCLVAELGNPDSHEVLELKLLLVRCRLEHWDSQSPQGDITAQGSSEAFWIDANSRGRFLVEPLPTTIERAEALQLKHFNPALLMSWQPWATHEVGIVIPTLSVPAGLTPIGF